MFVEIRMEEVVVEKMVSCKCGCENRDEIRMRCVQAIGLLPF